MTSLTPTTETDIQETVGAIASQRVDFEEYVYVELDYIGDVVRQSGNFQQGGARSAWSECSATFINDLKDSPAMCDALRSGKESSMAAT